MMPQQEKLSRKERDRIRHKEEILDAALKLFAQKGYHEVSIQEIAAQAEFAIGTLYNFFASKEALFEELADRSAEMIVGELEATLDGEGDEAESLRAFFRHQPELLSRHADFIKMYVSVMGTKGARWQKDRSEDRVSATLDARIVQLVESGIRKKLFRPVDPMITTVAINSILETLAFEMAGRAGKAELEDVYRKVEQLFLGGLLAPEGLNHE